MKIYHTAVWAVIFFAAISMSSCDYDRIIEDSPRNLYGDPGRSSNYEDYGEFYSRMNMVFDIEGEDTSGVIQAPLVVRSYQIVAATTGGSIVLLNNSGAVWTYKLEEGELVAAAMCADPNENIYAITNMGNLYKLDINGNLVWKKEIYTNQDFSRIFSDLLSTHDAVYTADRSGIITKTDTSGTIEWQKEFNARITETFAADDEGRIALALTKNTFDGVDTLAALSTKGKTLLAQPISGRIINTPVVSREKIYLAVEKDIAGSRLSKVLCSDFEGNVLWDTELSVMPRFISVDNQGMTYAIGYNAGLGRPMSGIYAIDSTGEIMWHMYIKAAVPSPAIITESQLIITGSTEEGIVVSFFNKNNGVLIKQISLSDAPAPYPIPAATPEKTVVYLSTTKLTLITIDDTQINKFLPY